MKTHIWSQCAATLLMLVAVTSCSKKKSASPEQQLQSVEVATPLVDSITLYKTYPGYAGATSSARIVARVNGTLLTKQYTGGDLVQKGQVLYTIDPTTYRDAVAQAEATLATAKNNRDYYLSQYNALEKAYQSDAVAQIEVTQARSNLENAEASIKNAQAALSTARENLSYCTIRAPFTGHIDSGTTDPGNYINGAGSPFELANIVDDSALSIAFAIEESQYEKLVGDVEKPTAHPRYEKVPLSFNETLPHEYYGKLSYTAPSVDKSTGTLTLKVRVDNPYGELRNGMYVVVHMPFGENTRAMLIKDTSIGTDQLGKYVYVVNDSNKVVYTPIKVGDLYQDSLRVVTEGLTPESRYVTTAMLRMRDGMEVKPVLTK